jgi:glycosyltransferase involved in cell wall biosynthesis
LRVSVVIPALDEEGAIGGVVRGVLATGAVEEVVVGDNGSRDRTAEVARAAGATVVDAPRRGYGSACLAALAYLRARASGPPEIVVFVDGDGSNDSSELPRLIEPILRGEAELVIGARGRRSVPGSMTFPQRFGNVLATRLLRSLYGVHYTDLGPFRAIAWGALERIEMADPDYGWTVEMQVKAARLGVPVREIDVANLRRVAGKSKVGGTVRGVAGAGYKILSTIFKYHRG